MKKEARQIQITNIQSNEDKGELNQLLLEEKNLLEGAKKEKSTKQNVKEKEGVKDEQKADTEKKGDEKKEQKKDEKKFSWSVLGKLFWYSLKRKKLFWSGILLNLGFAISVSWLPLKVGEVLDEITTLAEEQTEQNKANLKASMLQLGILTLFLAVFTLGRYLSLQFLQQLLAMDMRNDFYRKFLENDMHFFQKYKSGQLVSRLSVDVDLAKSAISNNLPFFMRAVIIIVSSFVVLFLINIKLTFMVLSMVPFFLIITIFYNRRTKTLVRKRQDAYAEISGLVAQKFTGVQLVKAYSTEEYECGRYSDEVMRAYKINKKKILLAGFYNSIAQFLPYLGIMIVLWYGGDMVISGSGELTAGELTAFILYCRALASASAAIAHAYVNIMNGTYAIQKIFQMLEYEPHIDEKKGVPQNISGDIQFSNVTFQYPASKTVAIRDLSFKIRNGQYVAFVGESGSGKSTIIKLIEKFYQIQAGKILMGNKDQSNINAVSLRKQIGLVNQEATLFSGTIRENIVYGLDEKPSEASLQDAADRAGCLQFINDRRRFPQRYDSQVGEKGGQLSGGQKQRISIARALLRRPKIIIFDEATSALDSNSQSMVQQSIENLAQNNSLDKPTIIVIAHRLSTVINANRIFVMKSGQIQETGSHLDLLQKHGYYYQLIEKQLADGAESSTSERNSKKESSTTNSQKKGGESGSERSSGYVPPEKV